MSILVTGGAGFIGSHLVERLLDEGRDVLCLDNFDDFYDPSLKRDNIAPFLRRDGFTLIEGDIRDTDLLDRIFRDHTISCVVHLAARAGVRPSLDLPLLYQDVNVRGTVTLLDACRRHSVKRFLFASSASVYGINNTIPFNEEDKIDKPISPYAATKAAGELLCFTYHHLYGFPVICLRFFTVYGPRQRPDLAIHKFTRMIARGEEIPLYGDGSTRRDYTYIEDIIDGVMGALRYDGGGYEIINLGDSRTVELTRLISLIEETLGLPVRIQRLPLQPGDVPITYADITKASRLLGYYPEVPIEEGIRRFVMWWRERCG
jgi:UDP-glucuronate 4-epimerase